MKNRKTVSFMASVATQASNMFSALSKSSSSDPRITSASLATCAILLVALLSLTGCGGGSSGTSSSGGSGSGGSGGSGSGGSGSGGSGSGGSGGGSSNSTITGHVHGGQQPVVGATITLYAPGTSGYGSTPTSIITTTTDASGNFTLPTYSCPSSSDLTFIVATGGNPGAGINTNVAEAALLPACSSIAPSTFIYISEVTTVAAAYALAPFASISATTTNIGTSSTNHLGLANALGPASNLADTTTGNARTASAVPGLILPTAEINTLANILAACVNTNINSVPSTTCSSLFTAATPRGGTAPVNTFQAAIDIALNPGNNAAALYALASTIAPFQPALSSAPPDFAVGIRYTGGLIGSSAGTRGIDIDSTGNAWVATASSSNSSTSGSLTEISPAGSFLSGSSGYLNGNFINAFSVAIDNTGNVFTSDNSGTKIAKASSSGALLSNLQPASLVGPGALAIDNSSNSVWIVNVTGGGGARGTTVTHMTATGLDATGSPYGGLDTPVGVAVDTAANIWVASSDLPSAPGGGTGAGYLTKFTPSGGTYLAQNFAAGPSTEPFDIAIDASNGVWVTDLIGVAHFNNAGTQISPSGGYLQTATTAPESIAVDGLNRTWVSNGAADSNGKFFVPGLPGSVSVFANDGTPISSDSTTSNGTLLRGYTAVGTIPCQPYTPQGIKIDASGNVWVTGFNGNVGAPVVTELVGIAAPVTTPLAVATSTNKLGTRP